MADIRFAPEPWGLGRVTHVYLLPEVMMISEKNHNTGRNYGTQHVSVQTHLRKSHKHSLVRNGHVAPAFSTEKHPQLISTSSSLWGWHVCAVLQGHRPVTQGCADRIGLV